jgi:hypothetical protein
VAAILAWVTFPGGGVYPWVWMPAACAVVVLALVVRARPAVDTRARWLDLMLMVVAAAIAMQLVPLPSSMLRILDPHAVPLRSGMWLLPSTDIANAALPISIVPRDTASALGVFGASVLLFWACRRICEGGGAGQLVRAIAWIGLVASVAAIVQRSRNQELLYGIWRPLDAGARPYGPFVNRNHFATWILMASPLVFGYLLARTPSRRPQPMVQRLVSALKQLGSMRVWLVTAVCVMTLALLISTSRSGLIGLFAALTVSALLSSNTREPRVLRWTFFQGALLVLVALWFANFDQLAARFDETLLDRGAGRGRAAIWADTQRVIRDFGATGTGAGTFGTAIAVYQTAEPGYSIGQAHNHFLQLAAEGGALLSLPAALTAGAFLVLLTSRLREGSDRYLRAGAAAGMIGVLVQSLWETGLRMPANAMLFALLAAIATHAPARRPD